jgi:hypothetical protein
MWARALRLQKMMVWIRYQVHTFAFVARGVPQRGRLLPLP